MTYTKKRIIIEADVPEGATHLRSMLFGGFDCWWRIDSDKGQWWSIVDSEWVTTQDKFIPKDLQKFQEVTE